MRFAPPRIASRAKPSWRCALRALAAATAGSALLVHPALARAAVWHGAEPAASETVMIIGGSMAHGWKDPHNDSYIKRAFASLTTVSGIPYTCIDRTITGGSPAGWEAKQPSQFSGWLQKDKPQVVVISWGLLNDISAKTPPSQFAKAVSDEIQQALQAHAVVLVVSPPVVKASVTKYWAKETQLIAVEFKVANQLHNPNVYTFDLFAQMNHFLKSHRQTIDPYLGDNWHPNGAGHALAGTLLFNDLTKTFGQAPIQFQTTTAAVTTSA